MNIIKAIWDYFKKAKPSPVKPVPEKPTSPSNQVPKHDIRKVAIIIGHGNGDSGAMGFNGMSEFNYNSFVAEEVANAKIDKEVKLFYRGSSGILGVAAKAVAWNPDLTLELHCNAFNGTAKGTEVLCLKGDEKSGVVAKSFALAFTKRFSRVLRRDQGINWIDSGDRGAASLKAVSLTKYSILVEPFFLDTPSEWVEPMNYAKFLIEWLNEL